MTSVGDGSTRDELEAALAARRDLGPAYDDALADSFIDKIGQQIEARVDQRLAERGGKGARAHSDEAGQRQWVLGIISLGTGIPITAIAGGTTEGVSGILIAWLGIVGVNTAHAWSSRRDRA
jgi:hypothetical protein